MTFTSLSPSSSSSSSSPLSARSVSGPLLSVRWLTTVMVGAVEAGTAATVVAGESVVLVAVDGGAGAVTAVEGTGNEVAGGVAYLVSVLLATIGATDFVSTLVSFASVELEGAFWSVTGLASADIVVAG